MQTREQAAPQPRGGNNGGQRQRFIGRMWRDIKPNLNPNYLVKGVLPRDGLAVVWGAKKSGKSFWVFDLVMHVVTGREFRGRKVRQGAVVYLALEGSSGFDNRVEAWRQRYCIESDDELPLLLINERLNLVEDCTVLMAAIRAQLPDVALIVIDTLNRALLGDENNSLDMGRFIRAADALGTAFGCLVLLIHHCGIAGSRPRGHTSLSGADDVSIAVIRENNGDDIIRSTVEHAKDFTAGAEFASKLESVELGIDNDGDPVTSCVIVAVQAKEAEPAEPADPSGRKVPKSAQLALEVLRKLMVSSIDSIKAPPEAELPPETRICRADRWREYFYKASPADNQDSKRRAYKRAHEQLFKAGIVDVWNEYVWLPPAEQTS